MLIRALPPEAPLWQVIAEEQAKAQKPTVDLIREKQAAFERRNAEQLAREAENG